MIHLIKNEKASRGMKFKDTFVMQVAFFYS